MRRYITREKVAFAKNLRRNQTRPERLLGWAMRKAMPDVPIYSQSIAYGYILDFYITSNKGNSIKGLAIEVDGPHHLKQIAQDKIRDIVLKERGIKTIRFASSIIQKALDSVVSIIKSEIKKIRE
jgi:very-short-patch-repair endonuclease